MDSAWLGEGSLTGPARRVRTWPARRGPASLSAMRRIARTLGLIILTWASLPMARTEETTGYTKTQAYNGALRFLRVEQELLVIEKDADLGYVLFEYPTGIDDDKTTGSLEVIEREEEVLVVIQISKLPAHHESRLVGALLKKLQADYGNPPKRTPKAKEPPKSDRPPPEDDSEPDDGADEPSERAPQNRTK
jgi:hypothetical protein